MIVLLLLLSLSHASPHGWTHPSLVGSQVNVEEEAAGDDDNSEQQSHGWTHPSLLGSEDHLNRQVDSIGVPLVVEN